MNQWKERIEEFLPEAQVGKIQSKNVKTKDKDIVIGMLQSISMIEYPDSVFEDFGLVIYDECHHQGQKYSLKHYLKQILNLKAWSICYTTARMVCPRYLDETGPIIFSIKKERKKM